MNHTHAAATLLISFFLCSATLGSSTNGLSQEVAIAQKLVAMHCQVDVRLSADGLIVERVDASGRIAVNQQNREPLTQDLLGWLGDLNDLRTLRLDVSTIRAANLGRELASLKSLRQLELLGTGPSERDDWILPHVSCLTNLESLALANVSVSESGFDRLAPLTKLKRLDLSTYTKMNIAAIRAIVKLPNLEHLRIVGECEPGSLAALSGCAKLTTISLGEPRLDVKLADLVGLTALHKIEIEDATLDFEAAKRLLLIKQLESLGLRCCSVLPEALPVLKTLKLRQLKCVGMRGPIVKELAEGMAGQWDLKASQ